MKQTFQEMAVRAVRALNVAKLVWAIFGVAVVGTLSLSMFTFVGSYIDLMSHNLWDPARSVVANFGQVLGWGSHSGLVCTYGAIAPASQIVTVGQPITIADGGGSYLGLTVNGWQWGGTAVTSASSIFPVNAASSNTAPSITLTFAVPGTYTLTHNALLTTVASGDDCPSKTIIVYSAPVCSISMAPATTTGDASTTPTWQFTDTTNYGSQGFSSRTWSVAAVPATATVGNTPFNPSNTASPITIGFNRSGIKRVNLVARSVAVTNPETTITINPQVTCDSPNLTLACTPTVSMSPIGVVNPGNLVSWNLNMQNVCTQSQLTSDDRVTLYNSTTGTVLCVWPANGVNPTCTSQTQFDPYSVFTTGTTVNLHVVVSNGENSVTSASAGFTMASPPWFQVESGNVHIDESTSALPPVLFSNIPGVTSCTAPGCTPYFYKAATAGMLSSGLLTYRIDLADALDFGQGAGLGTTAWSAITGQSPSVLGGSLTFNYQYWYDKLYAVADIWSGVTATSGYYIDNSGNTVNISSDWSIPADTKIVVLIKGDVNINSNITVAANSNAALLIVSDGKITIGRQNTLTQLHGFYIANTIETLGGDGTSGNEDSQLVVEGGLIAANAVTLGRNAGIGSIAGMNLNTPSEVLKYRPDIANTLRLLRELETFEYIMNEVAPDVAAP